jgi:hypothetical protein
MGTATKIATEMNPYGDGLQSGDIVVTGARWGKCSIGIVPAGRDARTEQDGPLVPGPWGYTVTHAAVIDNTGQAYAEYMAAMRVELGEVVEIEGLPGTYTFENRDARKLEGDGVKLVPADDAARANEARVKAANELGWMDKMLTRAAVTSLKWRADRAEAAIAEVAAAGGETIDLQAKLAGLKAAAAVYGKEV